MDGPVTAPLPPITDKSAWLRWATEQSNGRPAPLTKADRQRRNSRAGRREDTPDGECLAQHDDASSALIARRITFLNE